MSRFVNNSVPVVWLVAAVVSSPLIKGQTTDPPGGQPNVCLTGRWNDYVGAYSDVWGDGNYAYVPNWSGGDGQPPRVHILDISDPTDPQLASTFFLSEPEDLRCRCAQVDSTTISSSTPQANATLIAHFASIIHLLYTALSLWKGFVWPTPKNSSWFGILFS